MAEVYEVATFYHHFDVVREGEAVPARAHRAGLRRARLRDGRCAAICSRACPRLLGTDVRVLHAPCVGRCEAAPVAVVHQHPVLRASIESVQAEVGANARIHPPAPVAADAADVRPLEYNPSEVVNPAYVDFEKYRAAGGYELFAACAGGKSAAARAR